MVRQGYYPREMFRDDVAFILPANDREQTEAQEADLRRYFPDCEYFAVFGASSFFDAWRQAIPQATKRWLILTHQDTRITHIPDLEKWFGPTTGLAGAAGSRELTAKEPWWFMGDRLRRGLCSGLVHHAKNEKSARIVSHFGPAGRVVILDGVVLITRKDLLEKIGGVPEKDYAHWDFYDHVLCMEFLKAGLEIRTLPIQITHFSGGNRAGDETFNKNAERFKAEYLPLGLQYYTER